MSIAALAKQRLLMRHLAKQAEDVLLSFSKEVIDALKPPAGPYALFNHNSHAFERLRDVHRVLERLYDQRIKLFELDQVEHAIIPNNWPANTPFPPEIQEVMKENQAVGEHIKMDFESLYLFENILLDQWSLMVAYSVGLKGPEDFTFFRMVECLEDPKFDGNLKELWEKIKEQILWLKGQVRFYRNKFVVHADRPWQRGNTRSTFGTDFHLFMPSPPGWLNDEEIAQKIKALLPLAPNWLKDAPDDYWEKVNAHALLARLLDHIGHISDKSHRDKVLQAAGEFGTTTPTFQVVGERILLFVRDGTNIVKDITLRNLGSVNLGKSNNNSPNEEVPSK